MSKCRKEREHPVTTFTVTDCGNDRQLQDFVNRATGGDTITFACSGTITLTSTLNIKGKGVSTAGLTLDGNGEAVVLNGDKQVGVFRVEDMVLSLKGLTIINGRVERGGGLFNTGGKVSITNCTFRGNTAQHGGGLGNEVQAASPSRTAPSAAIQPGAGEEASPTTSDVMRPSPSVPSSIIPRALLGG
jgi:hypothetical protein